MWMPQRPTGARLKGWGLSEKVVARFLAFCEAKESSANKQMENALGAYMDAASDDIKARMAAIRRRIRDASANNR